MATETVSKTKEAMAAVPAVVVEVTPPPVETPRKTVTNWRVFEQGGFTPVRIRCEGYLGAHPADLSCHSNLQLTAKSVIAHLQPEHSGGWFKFKFRISDSGKVSPIWRELEDAGVEMQHFYCSHCRQDVPMTPRAIVKHLQPHAGATRINPDPQSLCMSLGYNRADLDEYDSLYEA